MCHWQNADDMIAWFYDVSQYVYGKVEVVLDGAVGEHHSLGESCRATGVVDHCQFVWSLLFIIMYVLSAEIFGVFLSEHLVEVLASVGEFVGTRHEERVVGDVDDALECWHLGGVDDCRHHIAGKQQLGVGVVDDVVYLVGRELMEYRHCDGTVGQRGEECHSPVAAVATAQGYLVAFLHSTVLKHDVQLFYLACHIMVLQCLSFIVCQSIAIPIFNDAFLD